MKRFFKILIRYLKWIFSIFFLIVISYSIIAFIFSIIPVNRNVASSNEINVYIKSNGVHLALVLPLQNEIKDWTTDVWIDSQITRQINFISFGWGDKEFYLNTPEWSDLSLKTAITAAFLKSPSAIHIDYYKDLQINDNCKMISINKEQYKTMVDFVEKSFLRDSLGNTILIQGFQTNSFDCYYDASNSYNLFFTCNTWTNKCLKESGLKACLWTPFDKGTLYHYRKMRRNDEK